MMLSDTIMSEISRLEARKRDLIRTLKQFGHTDIPQQETIDFFQSNFSPNSYLQD
jgi:hypothetical protein